jgi:hypothetical protein
MRVTFPALPVTDATLVVSMAKKDLPDLPFGEESAPLRGLKLSIAEEGHFVTGGDTTCSVILQPRQFLSEAGCGLTGLDPTRDHFTMDITWLGEHHLDAISVTPRLILYVGAVKNSEPVKVEYVPGGEPAGDRADWPVRLVPGDRLFLDFKAEQAVHGEGAACLVSFNGYFVGPAARSGVRDKRTPSMWLASANPCPGPTLSGHVAVSAPMRVDLSVYDVRGRLVRKIKAGQIGPGTHEFEWDLRTGAEVPAAAGLYFLRLDTPGRAITRKLVIRR